MVNCIERKNCWTHQNLLLVILAPWFISANKADRSLAGSGPTGPKLSRGGGGRGQDGGGGGTAAGAPLPDHTRPKLKLYFEKVAQV